MWKVAPPSAGRLVATLALGAAALPLSGPLSVENLNEEPVRMPPSSRSVSVTLMLVAARLRHVAGTKWGSRRDLDMDRLKEVSAAVA